MQQISGTLDHVSFAEIKAVLTKTSLAASECDTGIHVLLTKLASNERDHKNVRRRPGLIHASLITLLVGVRVGAAAVPDYIGDPQAITYSRP